MKKHYLLLSAAMLLTVAAKAQGNELFFSEYDEGAHQNGVSYNGVESKANEKAIEIYNPTTSDVNLNAYSIRRYSNGAGDVYEERLMRTNATATSNILARNNVFVIANPDATLPDIVNNRSQISAPRTAPAGTANVLQIGGTVFFDGNDAMVLVRYPSGTAGTPNVSAGVIVDIIGVIGENPGTSWSATDADGVLVTSANQSLKRRDKVSAGTRINPTPQFTPGVTPPERNPGGYNISTEWESYSTAFNGPGGVINAGGQSYAGLTGHDYDGARGNYLALANLKEFNDGISLYPNPASGTATVEIRGVKVGRLTVLNALGQSIMVQPRGLATEKITLDVSKLRAGLYFVKCESADGQLKIYKELMVK